MISRQGVVRRRDGHADIASASPWQEDDLVVVRRPGVGLYGDPTWIFPPDRQSGRPVRIEFGDADMFPSPEWRGLARDLAMALIGRRPSRTELVRSRQKAITVAQCVRRIGVLGRWAEATGHGLPSSWTRHTVDAFVMAYNGSRLPTRVAADSPKAAGATRQTLAAYLNLIAMLHEHRNQLANGMTTSPWPNWPAVGAYEIAGVEGDLEGRTAIVEPDAWWAAVRAALRIVNEWSPEILTAWRDFHAATSRREELRWGPELIRRIKAWADDPNTVLPIHEDGRPSWGTVAAYLGVPKFRGSDRRVLEPIVEQLTAAGRTSRRWWPRPTTDDKTPPWLGRMTEDDVFSLASTLRNAALVVLAALSAMRDSEMQELREGCVQFHDGSWALASTIQKQQSAPAPGVWWVTPVAVQAINVLQDLVSCIEVFVLDDAGERQRTDHLVCTLASTNFGRAGLASAGRPMESFVTWVDENAATFGLDVIGTTITPHQFRRTFAVVAAWQPDGHVAVELQLKDTAEVAAGYYANQDRKWFAAYELAKAEALAQRLRGYVVDDDIAPFTGPAGAWFTSAAHTAHDVSKTEALDAFGSADAQQQAAIALAGRHACGDGWDCAGNPKNARCLAVQAACGAEGDRPTAPQLTSGLCFDLGAGDDRACRNVILDPPAHIAFWDVEAARLTASISTVTDSQPLFRRRLQHELNGAHATIADMDAACRRDPRRFLRRFEDEHLRLLERLADDNHAPGTAALYRPLIAAQEERIRWLRLLIEEHS